MSGELDTSTAPLLTDLVKTVAGSHPAQVVLDLAEMTFFCAAGISALIRSRKMIVAAGGHLLLSRPSPPTRRLLKITGTDELFPIDSAHLAV